MLILQEYVPENKTEFLERVKTISYDLGIEGNWLMAAMFKESRLNHTAVNQRSGATGLIQFMPATAASLGTTTAALKNMSNVKQLDYVFKYLQPYRSRINSYVDLYLSIFFPAAIGKERGYILRTSSLPAELIASQNPGMDYNKNFVITKDEVEIFALAGFPPSIVELLKKKTS